MCAENSPQHSWLEASTADSAQEGQTAALGADDDVAHHFVTFVCHQGRLLELDGCLAGPVDHGPCAPEALLAGTAKVIQEMMAMPAEATLNFSAVGLVSSEEEEVGG